MCDIWGYVKTHITFTKYFSIRTGISIGLTTPAHMLNGYEICLNMTNSDFQYARFQILAVYIHFGLFWSAGILTMAI